MTRITYNKLIRDRIPEIIQVEGKQYQTKVMPVDDYLQALRSKLVEEASEVATADANSLVKELADLQEVIDALMESYGIQQSTVLQEQVKRRVERGGFEQRLKLLWVDDDV